MRPISISIVPSHPKRPTAWRLAPVVLASVIAASASAQGVAPQGYGYPQGQGQYGQDYGQPPVDPSGNPLGDPGNAVLGADPSSRVATLTDVGGNVSFAPAGSDTWAATGLNRPVTTGDRLWVDPGGRAELHAGSTAVRLAGATAVSVLNLDDDTTQVKLTQGTLQLRVRALPQGQTVEVDTPNLAFVPTEPGDYRLDVAPDGSTTTVTMRHGRAVLYGDSRSTELERGERVRYAGTDLADAGAGNLAPTDAFDRWTADRDAREDRSVAAQYVPRDMTGYTALDDYGDWQQDADYGAVWFPRAVSPGWAPYSVGQWAWVAPWGWTWVDDAPWGFAPSHYGRWAHVGSRWGWVPGPANVRPYYAPAVVGFIGSSTQIRIGGGPGVAWYPLGPGERYRPIYRSSPTYLTRINHGAMRDWNGRGDRDRWFNRGVPGAITGMPARGFVEGRPSAPYRAGNHADEWRRIPGGEAHGGPAIAPVKTSLIGGAPVRNLPPQARQTFDREAIAARAPGFVRSDDLARRFAREGGTAGAGPAWRGPQVPDARQLGRSPQPVASYSDVRVSQAAQHPRDRQPWQQGQQGQPGRPGQPQGFVSAPGAQGADNGRTYSTRPDQMRGLPAEAQRQQQALQRQQFEQQRQLQEQQRQGPDFQRQQQQALQRQQFEQQRQLQEQQRQGPDFQRQQQQALQRQQFEQQRQLQEQQRQGPDFQRQQQQALQRQQFEQQRQMQDQQAASERMRQDQQRQAMQRQQQDQQRAFEQQRQQQEQQRQAMQRQQQDQQRMFEQQRQQQDQQRAADQQRQAMQRAQQEQQQRMQQEQQRQQSMQRQQMEQQRQAQEQQRQAFEQQRQQQQHQQQQQQQQQQRQFQQQRGQQARNDDRR